MEDLVPLQNGETLLQVPFQGDLEFQVEWKLDDGTQVTITAADAEIDDGDGAEVLDFTPYITIVAGEVRVLVPDSVIKTLVDWGTGYWALKATSSTGSNKTLLEGPAILRKGAARD